MLYKLLLKSNPVTIHVLLLYILTLPVLPVTFNLAILLLLDVNFHVMTEFRIMVAWVRLWSMLNIITCNFNLCINVYASRDSTSAVRLPGVWAEFGAAL